METIVEQKWYAVRVSNNKEKEVKKHIEKTVEIENLVKYFGEALVATEKETKIKNGTRFSREKITFPGYVFVKANLNPELERMIKRVTGVLQIITDTPMKESEVNDIIGRIEDSKNEDPTNFSIGETVKILDGAFATLKGTIDEIFKSEKKVKLSVPFFNRTVSVDMTFMQIEKIKD